MTAPRTFRYSRPAAFCGHTATAVGVRDGITPRPISLGVASGLSNTTDIYCGATAGVSVATNAVPSNSSSVLFDFLKVAQNFRVNCTATTGTAPTVIMSVNGAAPTAGATPGILQISTRPNDLVRIGIRPTAGAAGTGTFIITNRPEFGTGSYSFSAAVTGDVIPNAINWGDISYDGNNVSYVYATKQITGIDQTITLKVNLSSANSYLYRLVGNNPLTMPPDDLMDYGSPLDFGMTQISDNGTFTVQNNQYISFGVFTNDAAADAMTVTVRNASNGDAVLDTFSASWTQGIGPS